MKRARLRNSLFSLLLATVLLLPVSSDSSYSQPAEFDSVAPLAWSVPDRFTGELILGNHCTAFSIDAVLKLWLTAAHCVTGEDGEYIEADYQINGALARLVAYDPLKDIAVLQTPLTSAPALKLAKREPKHRDAIHVIGHPFGWNTRYVFEGYISALNNKEIFENRTYVMFDMTCAPGCSGAPVLNKNGEVVSVLQIGYGAFTRMSGGVPFKDLRSFIDQYMTLLFPDHFEVE